MYIFFIFGLLFLMLLSRIRIKSKHYAIILIGFLSISLYFFDPYLVLENNHIYSVDSIRYFYMIDNFRSIGEVYDKYLSAPLSRMYLYWFSIWFDDNNLIFPITVILFYGISFYILIDFAKKNSYTDDAINFGLIIFVLISNVFFVIECIRYPIAMSLFMLVFYCDVIIRRKYASLLYVIPVMMHPGTILLLFLRIMATIPLKIVFLFIFVACIIAFYYFFDLISLFFSYIPKDFSNDLYLSFIGELQYKIFFYSAENNTDNEFGVIGYAMTYLKMVLFLFIVVYIEKINLFRNKIFNRFAILGTILSLVLVFFNVSYRLSIPLRLFYFYPFYLGLYSICLINKNSSLKYWLYFLCLVIFIYTFFQEYKNTLAIGLGG